MTQTTLPLSGLRLDTKANVRTIGRGVDPEFVASIKANGVKMPLIVRPNGNGHLVIDGGQRLEALHALVKSGDLPKDHPIPVVIETATDAEARETSLTLNVVRTAMHPVDEYRAFAQLHVDKTRPLDVDAIAKRFGVARKIVEQRLALGALDESILDAWLKEEIRDDAAQAFTLIPDKKFQVAIFAKLKKLHRLYGGAIKAEIKAGEHNAGAMLNEIGVEPYQKRGGKITRDLFGEDHVVSDPALLQTMIDEKVASHAAQLKADGWAWVLTTRPENLGQYGRLDIPFRPTAKEKAELTNLASKADGGDDDAYEAHDNLCSAILQRGMTPKIKKGAGCVVSFGPDAINIAYGLVAPVEKIETKKTKPADAKTKVKSPATLTKALTDRLTEQRLTAIKTALTAHPHANPFASMLAGIVASQIHPESRWNPAPDQVRKKFDAIADAIAPKIMNAALRKAFDAKAYFEGCGKTSCLAAITEAINADEARKLQGKKRIEIAKFATTNVGKSKWLPKELRTAHYDGPQKKR